MKTELNKKEKELMHIVAQEWVDHFNSLEFDQKKAEEFVDFIYELSGLEKPLKVVCESPLGQQVAHNVFDRLVQQKKGHSVGDSVRDSVENSVENSVWNSVFNSVGDSVRNSVRNSVWNSVFNSVRDSVWNSVEDSVGNSVFNSVRNSVFNSVGDSVFNSVRDSVENSVENSVWNSVFNSVWDSVRNSVEDSVWDSVRNSVEDSVWDSVRNSESWCLYGGTTQDSYWVAFYDYFDRIGIDLKNEYFQKYKELLRSGLFCILAFDGVAFLCKPPTFLKRDARNRMHNTEDYAIAFADGYGQYYVDGTFFEPDLFKNIFIDKQITFEEIMNLRNSEQKAVAIKYSGSYITFPKDNRIDTLKTTWNNTTNPIEYELYDIEIESVTARFVKVQWYEKGELRTTFIGVPAQEDTKDCISAIAWTFGMTKEEYKLQIEA